MPKLMYGILAVAIAFMLATGPCFANELIVLGKVSAIDASTEKFTVTTADNTNFIFASTPATDYEWANKIFDNSKFGDLKQGLWVKVEYIPGEIIHTAVEVDLYKEKK